jgi:CheY-like chemotaxis protein
MSARYLLFVEDREEQRMLFRDAVRDWNEENPDRPFEPVTIATYEEAVDALERTRFDGALFDLRLPAPGHKGAEKPLGNDLAQRGLHQNGIPVAILSAKPNETDPEFVKSDLVEIFDKGDGDSYSRAVAWFGEKWTMLDALASARTTIRVASAALFNQRIWPRWGAYLEIAGDRIQELTPVLTRQFVWHLSEVMGLGGETNDLWHPLETWICPPLQPDRASTGDVFELDGSLWIVLSPPCDLANPGRIENVLFVGCSRDLPADWQETLTRAATGSDAQRPKAIEQLKKLVNQAVLSQHFFPPLPDDPRPVVAQFGTMKTVPIKEVNASLDKRKGSVAAPFVNNLIQRFGAYISRVGQPNLDVMCFLPPQDPGKSEAAHDRLRTERGRRNFGHPI